METLFIVGFFCIVPLLLFSFGVWVGKGAPGWPWKVVRRDEADIYEGEETYPRYLQNRRPTGG